jgi:anaerobic selenocysteine-containing dehydrogenase
VVSDFFITPSAELADYVLPTTTWLERDELCHSSYTNLIVSRQKTIEPLFECWDDIRIVLELIKKILWAETKFMPWKSTEERNNYRIEGMGITFRLNPFPFLYPDLGRNLSLTSTYWML